jgi:predicted lipoprotein with Yx(FWY)xxD motif
VLLDAADGTLRGSANGAPRALYFWGADLPAGTKSAAASACTEACLAAWPVFHASPLVLPPELDAKDFGELQRSDGALQTTFKGWPLYLYAAETDETTHTGDGAQQLWHVAQQPFYSLVIMKSQASPEQPAYLADGAGRTIYELLGDTAGSASADPISTCTTAGCRRAWPTVSLTTAKAVSSIAGDIDIFIRPEALEFQLSYKGLPLYYYNKDELPGDLLGVGKTSWVLAVP